MVKKATNSAAIHGDLNIHHPVRDWIAMLKKKGYNLRILQEETILNNGESYSQP